MSYYVSSREDARRVRNPVNHRREGLPGDEWRELGRAHRRDNLEDHFSGESRAYQRRPTAYESAGLDRDRRYEISATRNATRAALGANFDPYDADSYARSSRRGEDYGRSRAFSEAPRSPAIPQRYRDEYNRLFNEDDRSRDTHQYRADMTSNAPWRQHAPLDSDHYRGEPSTHRRRTSAAPSRVDSAYDSRYDSTHFRPNQPSAFDWDEDSVHQPSRRDRFMGMFRR